MKIALLLSGKHEMCKKTRKIINENIIRGNNCDTYIHTWNGESEMSPISIYDPIKAVFEKPKTDYPFQMNEVDSCVPPINTFSQFYSFNESLKLTEDKFYNFYVKSRFDVWFLNKIDFSALNPNKIYFLPYGRKGIPRYSQKWVEKYGNNTVLPKDFLFIFSHQQKDNFLDLYGSIEHYNTKENIILCAEDLLFHHIAKKNIDIEILPNQDVNGLVRPPNHHQGEGYIVYNSEGFHKYKIL